MGSFEIDNFRGIGGVSRFGFAPIESRATTSQYKVLLHLPQFFFPEFQCQIMRPAQFAPTQFGGYGGPRGSKMVPIEKLMLLHQWPKKAMLPQRAYTGNLVVIVDVGALT